MRSSAILTYLAGFITACAALYLAGGHAPILTFAAGALSALAACAGLRWASRRARRPGRSTPRSTRPLVPDTNFDVISALVNFGADKKAAISAVARIPAGSFDDRFRSALAMIYPARRRRVV